MLELALPAFEEGGYSFLNVCRLEDLFEEFSLEGETLLQWQR